MDWSALGLVLAGGAVSWIGQYLQQRWGRKDKEAERANARTDKHRDDLRAAYGAFIAAATSYLDRAGDFGGIEKGIAQLEAEGAPISDALTLRARQALEDFRTTSTEAESKALAVMLLEQDTGLRERVREIAVAPLKIPLKPDEIDAFGTAIEERRKCLHELMATLAGSFAPAGRSLAGTGGVPKIAAGAGAKALKPG